MTFNFQPTPNSTELWGDQREYQVYEATQNYGRKIYYLKAVNVNVNDIFGEAISRDFLSTNAYEMYATRDNDTHFSGVESFGGFGLVPMYQDILFIPIKYFKDINYTPYEGDLIYYEDISMLLEIVKADTKTEDYNGDVINARRFNHKLYLKLYSPADDNFTGFNTMIPQLETFDAIDLLNINETLTNVITTANIVKPASTSNPFGDLS
jgi:hypothetical protein